MLPERFQIKRNPIRGKLRAQGCETGQVDSKGPQHEPVGALYQLNLVTGPHPTCIQDSCGYGDRRFDVILTTKFCSLLGGYSGKAKIARSSAIRLLRRTRG